MSARHAPAVASSTGTPADLSWASLLFGDDPWPMLLVLLAIGFIVYILAREAVPAILAVVLVGLAANVWWIRRTEALADQEEHT